ncbi:hypothetical protein BC835DRAFT_144134 [Cytidiella melzeri]|nr:hypothetical protein BC835DRAFT_144134 [Cytidiella melzeri]
MVDWRSPEIEALCAFLFHNMAICMMGAFAWWLIQTWHIVEGALIARRLKLSCAHIPYLLGRYGQSATLTLLHTVCSVLAASSQMQKSLTGFYSYTAVWDWIILVLTVVGLRRHHVPLSSPLQHVLVTQGVLYVLIACMTCIPMSIVVSLDLNGCMTSVIAWSAVVVRLHKMKDGGQTSRRSLSAGESVQPSDTQLTTNIDVRILRSQLFE